MTLEQVINEILDDLDDNNKFLAKYITENFGMDHKSMSLAFDAAATLKEVRDKFRAYAQTADFELGDDEQRLNILEDEIRSGAAEQEANNRLSQYRDDQIDKNT